MTADKHEIITIARASTEYPKNVELCLGKQSPDSVHLIGNRKILNSRLTALFCSSKCPGDAILKTYDLAQRLRSEGKTIISGFHSTMEKECLDIFLRSTNAVVICPSRGLSGMLIKEEWKTPLKEGKLLILSPFSLVMKRGTEQDACFRNRFVAAIADEIIITHSSKGGKMESLSADIQRWGADFKMQENRCRGNISCWCSQL